jgi:serine/threonine protein kinase
MSNSHRYDWFILAAASDRAWAGWAANELQQAGYRVAVPWDLRPGNNIILTTGEMLDQSERCLVLLSQAFELDPSTKFPLSVFLQRDPTGQSCLILPVLIERYTITGYLNALTYLDMTEASPYTMDAQATLLDEVRVISTGTSRRPRSAPTFPRGGSSLPTSTGNQPVQGISRSTTGATTTWSGPLVPCLWCSASNKSGAKFCNSCGRSVSTGPVAPIAIPYGTTPSQTGLLPLQQVLKQRYRIEALLGQGGMGAVYRAEDTEFDRIVAVKEMSQLHLNPAEIREAAENFKRESKMLARLQHPNLPSIFDHFTEHGRWYVVMSYIEGETLEHYVQRMGGHLSPGEAFTVVKQIANVLQYLHSRQPAIIFRDLKPANIMRTDDGHLYLIDFGIARHFKPGQVKDTQAMGSPGWAAPEQYGKAQTTAQSDIYSLGALLHHLITGDDPAGTPFAFSSVADPSRPASQSLQKLISDMTNMTPSSRPANMLLARQRIEEIEQHWNDQAAAVPVSAQPVPRSTRGSATATPGMSPQTASPWIGLRQVTLLYAPKDTSLAQELESHLQAATQSAGLPLVVRHNAAAGAGTEIAKIWSDRLQNSDVFVPLVSADIWGPKDIWGYVQEVFLTKKAEQIVPVLLRPCVLDQGTFQGLNVVPGRPITSFSGAAKESAWLDVVTHIIQTVKAGSLTRQPSLAAAASVASQVVSAQPYSLPPSPAATRRVSVPQNQPSFSPSIAPSSTSSLQRPTTPATSLAAPPSSKEWEITLLFAPEDTNWIAPMTRIFTIMQRTLLSSLGIRFIIHQGAEGLQRDSDELLKERIASSRLTLALVSPDFLASDWIERYDGINAWLRSRGQNIIPVLLRDCKWEGGVPLPRNGAIKRVGNDAAWTEVAKEIRTVLEGYYPGEMPQRRTTSWR